MQTPKLPVQVKDRARYAGGAALMLAALQAGALSLGEPVGVPVIGRPLQIAIPARQLDPDSCVHAELAQAEVAVVALRSQLERGSDGNGIVRLTSPGVVREPVVTVTLTVGCAQPLTREYVLLSEAPLALASTDMLAQPPLVPVPAERTGSPAFSGAPRPVAATTERPRGSVPVKEPAIAPRRADPGAAARPPRPSAERASRVEQPARRSGPRLKLETLDVAMDEAPALKISTTLSKVPPVIGAVPATAPPVPRPVGAASATPPVPGAPAVAAVGAASAAPAASAAAALVPAAPASATAAGASPAAPATNPLSLQAATSLAPAGAIDAELRALREQVQRHGSEMRRMAERTEQVNNERNLLGQALAGLFTLLAAALGVVLWNRAREPKEDRTPWSSGLAPVDGGVMGTPRPAAAELALREELQAREEADQDTAYMKTVAFTSAQALAASDSRPVGHPELRPFSDSELSRVPTAEELLDIRQKADFFLAVDQGDKAIQLLESQLSDHLRGSPFVWMDLLDLCRRLGRPIDYERIREGFHTEFPVRLPAFDAANPGSGGLEDHPRALSRIMLLWPSVRVLRVIEESLFEEPAPGAISFDLEASRDLLLLYSVASEVVHGRSSASAYPSFPATMHSELQREAPNTTSPVPLATLDFPGLEPPATGPAPDLVLDDSIDLDFTLPPTRN